MNKTIKGSEVVDLIERAEAIIILDGNSALSYPSIEGDDEFFNIDASYDDGEGNEYNYSFKVWNDDDIEIKDNQMFLLEANEGFLPIQLLKIQDL